MADAPDWSDWRQLLETGMQFTAMTRAEAQRRAQDLVREGQLAQERVQSFVDDLVRTSRKRADELVEVVRQEIKHQLEALGVAPRGKGAKRTARKKPAKKGTKKKVATKKTAKKQAAAKTTSAQKKTAKTGTKKAAGKKKAAARKSSGSR